MGLKSQMLPLLNPTSLGVGSYFKLRLLMQKWDTETGVPQGSYLGPNCPDINDPSEAFKVLSHQHYLHMVKSLVCTFANVIRLG